MLTGFLRRKGALVLLGFLTNCGTLGGLRVNLVQLDTLLDCGFL
jgi:hypothetical protein